MSFVGGLSLQPAKGLHSIAWTLASGVRPQHGGEAPTAPSDPGPSGCLRCSPLSWSPCHLTGADGEEAEQGFYS